MNSIEKQRVYFPNLNGLRFIAALLVIIDHVESFKKYYGLSEHGSDLPGIRSFGPFGVNLFFILSGFLITYLLLTEEANYERISIKRFYLRRILRIWPLYFLIVILALCVWPNINLFVLPHWGQDRIYKDLGLKILFYFTLFPNIAAFVFGGLPYAIPTWSIGLEEQFYLIWPMVLRYFKKHRIIVIVIVKASLSLMGVVIASHYLSFIPHQQAIKYFLLSFNFGLMILGAFFAILLFQKSKYLKYFMNKYLFYASLAAIPFLLWKEINIPHTQTELYAPLLGIIVLNFAANDQIKISLENKLLSYLGKISYGLYMYHEICITISISIAMALGFASNWLIYPLTILLTILIAGLSYKYFESFFLRLKVKFSTIISGDDTKL